MKFSPLLKPISISSVCIALASASACTKRQFNSSEDAGNSDTEAVQIFDQSKPISADLSPYVGGIAWLNENYGPHCSGFISGPQEITTALHCLTSKDSASESELPEPPPHVFIRASDNAEFPLTVLKKFPQQDIVVFSTEHSFGKNHLKISKSMGLNAFSLKLVWAGLSKDLLAYSTSTFGFSLKANPKTGFFQHSLDTHPGASGGPLLKNGEVVGVHLGHANKSKVALNVGAVVYKAEGSDEWILPSGDINSEYPEIVDEGGFCKAPRKGAPRSTAGGASR